MSAAIALIALAAGLWFLMFSPLTSGQINFWPALSIASAVLGLSALVIDRKNLRPVYSFRFRYIAFGIAGAIILYTIFFVGNIISTSILPFAASQIEGVYSTREQASGLVIGLLLLLLIGPAEEIFWRGFIQRRLSNRLGPFKGFVIATVVYTLIHIWSFNFMLLGASAICGAFWGLIFLKYKSIWPSLISHAIWDVLIFVIIPVGQ